MKNIKDYRNYDCYLGLDLASKNDLACVSLVWEIPTDEKTRHGETILHYHVYNKYFINAEAVKRTKNAAYPQWALFKYLTVNEGPITSHADIAKYCIAAINYYKALEVGFDAAQSAAVVEQIHQNTEALLVEVPQTSFGMSESYKITDALIRLGRVFMDKNPVNAWCFNNALLKTLPNGNVKIDRTNENKKIDGCAATSIAIGRATHFDPRTAQLGTAKPII